MGIGATAQAVRNQPQHDGKSDQGAAVLQQAHPAHVVGADVDRLLEPGDQPNTTGILVRERIPPDVRQRAGQHPEGDQDPLADAGENRGRGKRTPARIRALRQHLQQRRFDQVLECPVGGDTHRQAEGEQRLGAVRFEAVDAPGEEQSEVGNHGADDDRGQ